MIDELAVDKLKQGRTVKQRIYDSSVQVPEAGCWLWVCALLDTGYPQIKAYGRAYPAHRVAYKEYKGEIPGGMHVLHKCDIPTCVNPEHLFLGTHTDNMQDMYAKGRQPTYKKVTKEEAKRIIELRPQIPARKLGKMFNVSKGCVDRIVKRGY